MRGGGKRAWGARRGLGTLHGTQRPALGGPRGAGGGVGVAGRGVGVVAGSWGRIPPGAGCVQVVVVLG